MPAASGSFIQLFLPQDLPTVHLNNRRRKSPFRVHDEVIDRMHEKLQRPNADRHAWEAPTVHWTGDLQSEAHLCVLPPHHPSLHQHQHELLQCTRYSCEEACLGACAGTCQPVRHLVELTSRWHMHKHLGAATPAAVMCSETIKQTQTLPTRCLLAGGP
jgi:hypothetical protein